MRLIEATAGGVVMAVVAVIVVVSLGVPAPRLVVAAVAFGVSFLAVLLRPDRLAGTGTRL